MDLNGITPMPMYCITAYASSEDMSSSIRPLSLIISSPC
ncbi:hypothetical protein HRbin05_00714 [archaeon HR05]|nr:hypothetical protein HRbin05_00714 [archaeon HR05]